MRWMGMGNSDREVQKHRVLSCRPPLCKHLACLIGRGDWDKANPDCTKYADGWAVEKVFRNYKPFLVCMFASP